MPYCPRCGVEADPSVRVCPLCSTNIPAFDDLGPGEPAWPSREGTTPSHDPAKTYATSSQRRLRAFLAMTSFLGTAALVVISVDLLTAGGLTWARWPLADFAAVLALAAALLVWPRRPAVWGATWALTTAVFLVVLDLCDDARLGWSLALGLPLTAATFGLVFCGSWVINRSRRLGYNLFGLIPGLAALELLAIDALVTAWTGGASLGWSVITSLVLFPLALLFYLLHFALRRTPDLRRIFHF